MKLHLRLTTYDLRLFLLSTITLLCTTVGFSQLSEPTRPKLVIGLMFDQMRWDYLYRYSEKYGNEGFKRLLNEGYSCENTQIPYYRAITAPGHTCVYTGSVPAVHGITGNEWYDRREEKMLYCTTDKKVSPVGGSVKAGQMSPKNLLTTTITDELRLATNFRSKVVALALKDRSAILPGGHTANAAYWFDDSTGTFTTSSYYMQALPTWVNNFNAQKLNEKLLGNDWNLLLEKSAYFESTDDNVLWENAYETEKQPVFPHNVSQWKKNSLIRNTPQGNTFTLEFAKAAIEGDTLGNRGITDFLAISCSATDGIGHQFGINAVETEDMYVRLDKEVAEFLKYLDEKIGKGNYLLFITADHGAANSADFSRFHKIPSSANFEDDMRSSLNAFLKARYNDTTLVTTLYNHQVYFNREAIKKKQLDYDVFKQSIKDFFLQFETVNRVVDLNKIGEENLPEIFKTRIINMYLPMRSGDLEIVPTAARLDGYTKGTTHGTPYPYDTHIPLVFYGWKVKNAKDYSQVYMTDIARTLAAMLSIQEPSGCTGKVIEGLMK
ncbi:MAG TPA: alkaline phosphatase PafA [Chitinophagales bacterium]